MQNIKNRHKATFILGLICAGIILLIEIVKYLISFF